MPVPPLGNPFKNIRDRSAAGSALQKPFKERIAQFGARFTGNRAARISDVSHRCG